MGEIRTCLPVCTLSPAGHQRSSSPILTSPRVDLTLVRRLPSPLPPSAVPAALLALANPSQAAPLQAGLASPVQAGTSRTGPVMTGSLGNDLFIVRSFGVDIIMASGLQPSPIPVAETMVVMQQGKVLHKGQLF